MSEKGKRGGPSGSDTATTKGDGRKFAAALQKIAHDFSGLCKCTGDVQDYGELLDSQATLKRGLEESREEVAGLQREVDGLRTKRADDIRRLENEIATLKEYNGKLKTDFGEQYMAWNKEKRDLTRLQEELARVQDQLKSSQAKAGDLGSENHKLHDLRHELTGKLKEHKNRVGWLENECEISKREQENKQFALENCQKMLEEVRDQLGFEEPEPQNVAEQFAQLSAELYALAHKYFWREIPDPSTPVDACRTLMQVPLSNSPAAQAMRCALAEAVIAQELCQTIFADVYVPSGVPSGREDFKRALAWLTNGHPKERIVIRCQLARAFERSGSLEEIASQAAQRACGALEHWLVDGNRSENFTIDLTEQFIAAATLWKPFQRAEMLVDVDGFLTDAEWFWRQDYGRAEESDASGQKTTSGSPLVVLFPAICTNEKTFYHGVALFAAQPSVKAATQELRNQPISRGSQRRRSSQPSPAGRHPQGQAVRSLRRMSIASTNGGRPFPTAASDLSSSLKQDSLVNARGSGTGSSVSARSPLSGSSVSRRTVILPNGEMV